MTPIESAARALCKHEGHPTDIRFEGAAMWRSFLPEIRAVLTGMRDTPPAGVDAAAWRSMIDAALADGDGIA